MTMAEQCCNLSNRNLSDDIPPTKFRYNTLILDNNHLKNMRNVKYCSSLRQLSACYNQIEDMGPVGFLQNLKLLHLIDNVISKITGIADCSRLEELSLSRNCLQNFTGLHHCTSLTKIDLSYNSINTLADISGLTSLSELYLHGNEITTLESAPLCLPVCLSVLSLADNRISDIGQLAYLTRLRVLERLSLAGNDCANNSASPYQIFAVMCCPSLEFIDHEPLTFQTREHARNLEKKMLISGEASFSAIRDERPRVRERSKTDITHSHTKENQPYVANVRESVVPERNADVSTEDSVYSAYDEYNNRPASSAVPRVRARRSSVDMRSPRSFSPSIESDGAGASRRPRSKSVFSPPSTNKFEREMDSESVYLNVSDDFSKCLDVTPELPEDTITSTPFLDNSSSTGTSTSIQAEQVELLMSAGSGRNAIIPEPILDLLDLSQLSQQEIIGVIKIQSVWRGYRCRKQNRNMIMSLAVRRYQQHYSAMTEQINQLTSDLNRERQLSSLYREMLYKMAGMLREKKPPTRSRLTQTRGLRTSDSQTQTQGLISTLLASFAVDSSHQTSVEERQSAESDRNSSPGDSSCEDDEVPVPFQNQIVGVSDNVSSTEDTSVSVGHESITGHFRDNDNNIRLSENTPSSSQNGISSNANLAQLSSICKRTDQPTPATPSTLTTHMSKYDELKKHFESPDHLAKMKSVSGNQNTTSTEVAASFIRNSIDTLRNSLTASKNSPTKREVGSSNQNVLLSSNGHESSPESDRMLDQFKSTDDIRNEPTI